MNKINSVYSEHPDLIERGTQTYLPPSHAQLALQKKCHAFPVILFYNEQNTLGRARGKKKVLMWKKTESIKGKLKMQNAKVLYGNSCALLPS